MRPTYFARRISYCTVYSSSKFHGTVRRKLPFVFQTGFLKILTAKFFQDSKHASHPQHAILYRLQPLSSSKIVTSIIIYQSLSASFFYLADLEFKNFPNKLLYIKIDRTAGHAQRGIFHLDFFVHLLLFITASNQFFCPPFSRINTLNS